MKKLVLLAALMVVPLLAQSPVKFPCALDIEAVDGGHIVQCAPAPPVSASLCSGYLITNPKWPTRNVSTSQLTFTSSKPFESYNYTWPGILKVHYPNGCVLKVTK